MPNSPEKYNKNGLFPHGFVLDSKMDNILGQPDIQKYFLLTNILHF